MLEERRKTEKNRADEVTNRKCRTGEQRYTGPHGRSDGSPFRLLCRERAAGCGLMCTEMVSAKALLYNNRIQKPILAVRKSVGSRTAFGSDPDIMSDMALRLEEGPYDIIDVNMGCPGQVNNGEGSALMKNPKLAEAILTSMVKSFINR